MGHLLSKEANLPQKEEDHLPPPPRRLSLELPPPPFPGPPGRLPLALPSTALPHQRSGRNPPPQLLCQGSSACSFGLPGKPWPPPALPGKAETPLGRGKGRRLV